MIVKRKKEIKMEELIKALNLIKTECEKHGGCDECPMCRYGECVINTDTPSDWKIVNPEIPKVFV